MTTERTTTQIPPTTAELLGRLPETSHEGSGIKAEPKASALSPYTPKRAEASEATVVKPEEAKRQEGA